MEKRSLVLPPYCEILKHQAEAGLIPETDVPDPRACKVCKHKKNCPGPVEEQKKNMPVETVPNTPSE